MTDDSIKAGRDPETGYFLPGNQFWKARSSYGRNPIFASADELETACHEYFEWCEANPLYEDKIISFQGSATHEPVAKMRAFTIDGLCLFLDIEYETWRDWRSKAVFSVVVRKIDKAIRDQKFTGAAADLLNPNIIARDLGLADRTELTGAGGGPIKTVNSAMTADEAAAAYAATIKPENA